MQSTFSIKLGIAVIVMLIAGGLTLFAVTNNNHPKATIFDSRGEQVIAGAETGSQTTGIITAEIVAQHTSREDCWLIIEDKVYDVTSYINLHPGGASRISTNCGKEATQAFETQGGGGSHSEGAHNILASFYIGDLNGTVSEQQINDVTETSGNGAGNPVQSIEAQYPGATITEQNIEDDGRAEVKFIWNGRKYEAKLDAAGNFIEVE